MLRGYRSVVLLLAVLALLCWKLSPGRSGSTPIDARAEPADAANARAQPQLVVQLGHAGNVLSVAYALDGQTALTGSDDQTARLWDIVTSREIRRFEGHSDAVQSVAISVDGQTVLTGSADTTARLTPGPSARRCSTLASPSRQKTSVSQCKRSLASGFHRG